ncbi:hypothetical protein [Blastococcus colisei]|uniref:hypothetical protein n=1 Tax=Blastococcus colisei TaxID=1564162 RepID=UPI001B87E25B|nr:hypothetical protein [Blastococcus colisei]
MTSVGWLGAVLAYLVLDVTAVVGRDLDRVRSAYVAMELTVLYAIVPLALASVIVGIVNALGSPWGLFRHYWVLVKLLLTLVATAVLVLETQTIRALAEAAASGADPRELPGTLPHSVGGLVVLLLVTVLSIYKPRGLTRYGWCKQQEQRRNRGEQSTALMARQPDS